MVKKICKVFKSRRGRNQGCLYVERLDVNKSEPIFLGVFFFGIFKFIFGLILDFFSILKRNIFKDLHALHTFRLVLLKIEEPLDVVLIYPWSAHDQPVIYRPPPAKCAKNFVLVNFFRFSKSREKSQKTQRKSGFLCHFLLIKTAFFLKRSSQKCIIKTIISYTTNAQLFHWKTVRKRKCLHTNVIHVFFNFWNCFCNILF